MPLNPSMWLMTASECALWAALAFLFWKQGLQSRFRAMGYYLALRAASAPVFLFLLYELLNAGSRARYVSLYEAYSVGCFATYLATAVLLFFICVAVLRSALSPFPGIAKIAVVIFSWASLATVMISLSSTLYAPGNGHLLGDISYAVMRSAGVLELCLLAFLCVTMRALGLPFRSLSFGIALGFGMLCSGDFIMSSLVSHIKSLSDPVQFLNEALILAALAVWTTYCVVPEPVRKPILIPASSTIYRWNEIASALGHGTRVAVQQPANGFFLSDVERVVEKVLAKGLKDRESET